MRFLRVSLPLLLALPLLNACAGSIPMTSQTADVAAMIDGDPSDWSGKLQAVDGAPFSLGVQNDGDMVYLAIVSANTAFREQVVRQGLVLWFDTQNGDEKTRGLGYPRGVEDQDWKAGRRSGVEEPSTEERLNHLEASFPDQLGTLEFLSSENSSWSMDVEALNGMSVAASMKNGRFVYEAAIPLFKGPERSFALGLGDSNSFALGIAVPAPERPGRGEGRQAGMGGGGRPGGMGGGRPGGGGGPPSGGRGGPPQGVEGPEPVEHWFKIELKR